LANLEDLQGRVIGVEVWSNGGYIYREMELPQHIIETLTVRGSVRMADDDSDEISIRLPLRSRR